MAFKLFSLVRENLGWYAMVCNPTCHQHIGDRISGMSAQWEGIHIFCEVIADDEYVAISFCGTFMHIQDIHGYPVKVGIGWERFHWYT